MKDLMLCVHVVVKFGNLEISRCHLADYVKELCVPHVQHGYISSFNQSDHCYWRRRCCCHQGALASTTATATTTPQIKNLIGRVKKNKRAARAARTYEQVRPVLCKTTT